MVIVGEKLQHAIHFVRRIISYVREINRIYSFQIVRWENTDAILSTRNVRCEIYEKFEEILVLENRNSFFFRFNLFGRFAYHVLLYLRFDDYFSLTSVLSLFTSLSFPLIFAAFSFLKLRSGVTRQRKSSILVTIR